MNPLIVIHSALKKVTSFFKKNRSLPGSKSSYQAEMINEEGMIFLRQGGLTQAESCFRDALKIDSNLLTAKSNLGQVLRLSGRLSEAEKLLREVISASPNDSIAYNRFATTLRELGKDQEAEFYYQKGLLVNPHDADILNNIGSMLNQYGLIIKATDYFKKAIANDPNHFIARCNLCVNLSDRGLHQEADQCFIEAIALNPDYYYARISYVMNKLYAVHKDEASIERCRSAYEKALTELCSWLTAQPSDTLNAASEAVGWSSPFYLTYQGKNNRNLQSIYGGLICKLMAHRYPELISSHSMPIIAPNTPLRIGIVSAFFYDHSNWKTPIKGWIENIDKSRFSIFGYYTGSIQDAVTDHAKQVCYEFRQGMSFEAMAKQIKADALHTLIFPEIGMDPVTTKLAGLRLAPIQCNSWGHPDTSGMPTIDYYLSSELMEPDDAQSHYTETLIRLPNLSIAYTPPRYNALPLNRKDFGLHENKILYCCAQSLFKYLPQFDYIFARIAKSLPHAQFIFFGHQKSTEMADVFMNRIFEVFRKEGLNPSDHVMMLSRLERDEFQTVLGLCDIYLDSIEWSGCNTTLEAFLCDIPVITYKGSMMRGRHTYSFLKMMGLDELISFTVEDYIALAIALGKDEVLRHETALKIKNKFNFICDDTLCVRALENFLENSINAYP